MRIPAVPLILLAGLHLVGCASDELTGPLAENQPPIVWLAIAPPQGSTVTYKVHVF